MAKPHTPREEALAWAKARAEARQVVGVAAQLPSRPAAAVLRHEGLLLDALDGAAWVLRSPDALLDDDQIRLSTYWPLAATLAASYAPAALDRISAIRAFVGEATPPPVLYLRHGQSSSDRTVAATAGHRIELMPVPPDIPAAVVGLPGTPGAPAPVLLGETPVPVVSPAWALLTITVGDLRSDPALVGAWLRSLVLPLPELRSAYEAMPRPVIASRLADLARQAGNERLADQITAVVKEQGHRIVARSKTGDIVLPSVYRETTVGPSPYVDRFVAQLTDYARDLTRARIGTRLGKPLPRADIIARAQAAKRDDIYHSTTIEGYRVTPADVEAVLSGRPVAGRTPDEVERLMALKGYARAFDETLRRLPATTRPADLTEGLILDLHVELWAPSVDAGIVRPADLRGWRTRPAFLRGSRYVPPGPDKVPALMRALCERLANLKLTPAQRAVLVHWGFETIHPFADGNGRVGRLLLNLVLGAEGVPWVTIRAEERPVYFGALERAQADGDILPWARFLAKRVRGR
jgi:Fic family protein